MPRVSASYWVSMGIILIVLFCLLVPVTASAEEPMLICGASSLTDLIDVAARAYEAKAGTRVVTSYASSSQLARQIEGGLACDVFVSAHEDWMAYVKSKVGVDAPGIVKVATNRLVVVSPKSTAKTGDYRTILNGCRRLAVGDPEHVPVGMYAKQSLSKLGLWDAMQPRLLPTVNARAVVSYVERGDADCAVIYQSDARFLDDERTITPLPEDSHDAIVYEAAVPKKAARPEDGRAFLKWFSAATRTGNALPTVNEALARLQ